MTRKDFLRACEAVSRDLGHQGHEYLFYHSHRLYKTFSLCRSMLRDEAHIVSVGAGSAYVEYALALDLHCRVTVVDFPEAIALNRRYYEKSGFDVAPADLTSASGQPLLEPADLVLSAEVIEHLTVPPALQLAQYVECLNPGGWCVVTTPNLGSARHIAKLVFMRPLLPPAEETFRPISYASEGVHRREYLAKEIASGMVAAGIDVQAVHYSWYHLPQRPAEFGLFPAEAVVGRFRPLAIIVGRKRKRVVDQGS